MPLGLLGGYLIGTGLSAVGSLIGNKMNQNASDQAYARDLELLKYQNEYNSPENQVKRLRAAGINPMLAFGGGNVSGNLTGALPRYQKPEKSMDLSGGSGMVGVLAQYEGIKTQKLMQNKIVADTDSTNIKNLGELVKNDILTTDKAKKIFEFDQLQKLSPYNLQIKQSEADLIGKKVDNELKIGTLREEEIKTKKVQRTLLKAQIASLGISMEQQKKLLEYMKKGIQPNDPWYIRIGSEILKDLGINSWSDASDLFINE